jgi:hypothetical protein
MSAIKAGEWACGVLGAHVDLQSKSVMIVLVAPASLALDAAMTSPKRTVVS